MQKDSQLDSPTPSIIEDRFQIERLIGAGSMAKVYLARDQETGREVAIKVLKPDPLNDQSEILARFDREKKVLHHLDHPNIVKVIEPVKSSASSDPGRDEHRIVMEFIRGGTLRDLLNRRGSLPIKEAIEIGLDIASALAYAHDKGVFHRDIKPSNVLLTEESIPRLTDFGLASFKHASTLTKTGTTMGTINYMSPEACRGEVHNLREKSDIWSFGVVLWEMLTGYQLFKRDNIAATLSAIPVDPLPDLHDFCPEASDSLKALLNSMLEKESDDRCRDMHMVAAWLEEIFSAIKHPLEIEETESVSSAGVRDSESKTQSSQLTVKSVEDALTALSPEGNNKVLDKARLVYIYSRRVDLVIDEPSYHILLRSSLFYGEPPEPWLKALKNSDSVQNTLQSFYETNPSAEVRGRTAEAMLSIPGESVDQLLLNIALTDGSPAVREKAALVSAERGYRLRITDETFEQFANGQDPKTKTPAAPSMESETTNDGNQRDRKTTIPPLASNRWQTNKPSIWKQTRRAVVGGGLLVLYGAAVPLVMKIASPETYDATISYMTLPAYVLISIILFGFYGVVQGSILGLSVFISDVIRPKLKESQLRLLVGATAGLFSTFFFIATQLMSEDPVPTDPALAIVVNITYGLIIGLVLSRVIPQFFLIRSRNEQYRRIGESVALSVLISIPYTFFIFNAIAGQAMLSRLLLAVMLPIALGIPFSRDSNSMLVDIV
ncbi:MAG TPA: protein kinase [candidate division Zixibacteria bacterium]|nr:protein kinase [candidate division Zixibacteria bacterium]